MKHTYSFFLLFACASVVAGAENPADSLAKTVLDKAGIRVSVCEMPQAGDGTLAAALARAGVAQVHALVPDAQAAAAARKPSMAGGVMGSQVIIETGKPEALPLGDWVADLYVVAGATDANLKTFSAAEAGRVLSPYRGVAVVGNPAGAKGGLTKAALEEWGKGTGSIATISEDASGLWAVLKMPPLKGGDDWTHFYHHADGNPVSDDTAIRRGPFTLQCIDKPRTVDKWGTVVAAGGRVFWLPGSFDHWEGYANELVVRNIYNGQILWRRPLEFPFGRNDSLIIATAERVYLKNKNNVLVLDPETGREITRLAATDERSSVRWLLLDSGVLVTLTGEPQYVTTPPPAKLSGSDEQNFHANAELRSFFGRELAGWDAVTGRRLWTFTAERIDPAKLAARDGRLFLYANNSYAACLDLKNGQPIWKTPAPITDPIRPFNIDWELNVIITGRQQALATQQVYLIASPSHGQTQAFSAADGRLLWQWEAGYPWGDEKAWSGQEHGEQRRLTSQTWKQLTYPMVLEGALLSGGNKVLDPLTGKPAGRSIRADMWGCGHVTATSSGLLMMQGGGVYDSENGRQLAENFMKDACGIGGGVIADGAVMRMSHGCLCHEWDGYIATRSVAPRAERSAARLERGSAALPVATPLEAGDWATYRANPERSASSAAMIPDKAAIRWMYLPSRSGRRPVGDGDWVEYEPDGNATPAISVGERIWFGTAEGALVCLDRQTGAERWRYWTTGRIMSSPTWHDGRLYAGSGDGWVYCLDAANGALIWRYRAAPSERRLMVYGYLGSAWPVLANVLVHDDTVFVSAGLMSELVGSVFCALQARTGAPLWEKRMEHPHSQDTPWIELYGGQNTALDTKVDTSAVGDTPETLFHAVRWGPAVTATISGLPPGSACRVRLYFAEPWEKEKGKRVFDVAVNGAVQLEKFDLVAAAGGQNKAVMREIPAATDPQGKVAIRLTQSDACKNNCVISGIQVLIADHVAAAFQTGGRGVLEAGFQDSTGLSRDLPHLPGANGQAAWYGNRIWFKSNIFSGPIVFDPKNGDMKPAVDLVQTLNDRKIGRAEMAPWYTWGPSRGQDIGILPGGWVALGGRQFFNPLGSVNQGRNRVMFLKATAEQACLDAQGFPFCLVVANDEHRVDIPAWDASEAVVYFDVKSRFQLCRDFSKALTDNVLEMKKLDPIKGLRRASQLSLSAEQCRPVLPDDLQKAYNYLIESPVLAGNAVVFIHYSHVAAVRRTDRKLQWDVELPVQPLPGGLSLTRSGEVLVPLVDGRIACIGPGEPALSPADPAHEQQPGLILQTYDFGPYRPERPLGSQWPDKNMSDIPSAGEMAALPPTGTTNLSAFTALNQACVHPTLVRLRGSIDVPETATYRFFLDYKKDGRIRFTVFDATGRFAEYSVTRGKNWSSQPRSLLLEKGKHPIEIIGYQLSDALQMGLDWQIENRPRTPVPAEALWHDRSEKP